MDERLQIFQDKMEKSLANLNEEFAGIRAGRANPHVLDKLRVDYYGTPTGLAQVATVLATDATTITISPWEKKMLREIEKAIMQANIGVNPNNDGESIKLFFPPMTTEQRKEGAKQAKAMGDKAKIAIRNVRKDSNDKVFNITIGNSMRRIIESYVNFIGLGKSHWDSIKNLDVTDPIYPICSALISEINDVSHKSLPFDDLYYQRIVNEEPAKLFSAFEMIFKNIGEEHYKMMMN